MTVTATHVAPTAQSERLVNLDLVRGVAVLGILLMNVVSFGLGTPAYFNLDAGGGDSTLDWIVGIAGEVLVDQKFMAVFSMLFGAGIVLFHERALAKSRHPVRSSLWRNFLLLIIGLVHGALWDGDVLTVYAICAPIVIFARRWSDRTLLWLGTATVMMSPVLAVLAQTTVGSDGEGLGEYWGVPGAVNDAVGIWLYTDFFVRALGMMFVGIAVYRRGIITGARDTAVYRRLAVVGGLVGVASASLGLAWLLATGFDPSIAIVASIPNTIGTIPAALAIVALITLAGRRWTGPLNTRLQAVGRMALTNYLAQTALGLLTFDLLLDVTPGRAALFAWVAGVWALQIWWSTAWLDRFRFGPAEWLWRSATYRTWQPLRRA